MGRERAVFAAERTLFATPAPDAAALLVKLETAWRDDLAPTDEQRHAILQDARRLLGGSSFAPAEG
jgi:hypothetical protein